MDIMGAFVDEVRSGYVDLCGIGTVNLIEIGESTLSADSVNVKPVVRRIIGGHLLFDELFSLLAKDRVKWHFRVDWQ